MNDGIFAPEVGGLIALIPLAKLKVSTDVTSPSSWLHMAALDSLYFRLCRMITEPPDNVRLGDMMPVSNPDKRKSWFP